MPVNPGSETTIPANYTGAQIIELHYAFNTASALFNEYYCTDKDLRKILLSTVDKMFIRSLQHKYVWYGLTTNRAILDHLYATYANLTSPDLQETAVFFAPLTMITNRSNPFSTRSKIAVTTPPPETLPTASNK